MICSKCGKTIADGAKFCTYCGAVQSGSAGGGAYRSGGDAYGRGGGDAFGSRGGAFDDRSRSRDAFGSRGDAFGSRGRGGDAFGGAPRRGGDAFGGAPRRGGGDAFGSRGGSFGGGYRDDYSRPARRDGEASFVLLLIGALLALAGGIVRLCTNIPLKDYLKIGWESAKQAASYSSDTALFGKITVLGMVLYHALPGLLMILFALLVITKGKRRPSSTGSPTILIPIVEFILLNVVLIWGMILASSFNASGSEIAGEIAKAELQTFLLPMAMEIVFAIVYIVVTGKLTRGRRAFLWIVPIMGAAAAIYMLVINVIYHDEHMDSGFLLEISGVVPMYLISFALFFAGASVAVFGFPRNGGRLPGPGRDSRDPYARGGRDSFGRY